MVGIIRYKASLGKILYSLVRMTYLLNINSHIGNIIRQVLVINNIFHYQYIVLQCIYFLLGSIENCGEVDCVSPVFAIDVRGRAYVCLTPV